MIRPRRSPPRLAQVLRRQRISQNMMRVTFTGDALLGFPTDAASANIKLLLAHDQQSTDSFSASLLGEGAKPIKRTYTVVEYRDDSNELDLDFALHTEAGPATNFALHANVGDLVGIAGPSQPKLVNASADWFLIAGDMTAIPAIEANIAHLPSDAKGYVVIEVQHEDDRRKFELPESVGLHYLIKPEPETGNSPLLEAVINLPWLDGIPNVWIAGESGCVRELRSYFAKTKKLDRSHRYTSGYWQIGRDEDAFQTVKRQEPDI